MKGGGRELLGEFYDPDHDGPTGASCRCAADCGSESQHLADLRWCYLCALSLLVMRAEASGQFTARVLDRIAFLKNRYIT